METIEEMGSSIVIEWSIVITEQAEEISKFLEENYSLLAAQKFYARLWDTIQFLKTYPTTGRPSPTVVEIRHHKIDKYRRLYYYFNEDSAKITLLEIFDTRQDPLKIPY